MDSEGEKLPATRTSWLALLYVEGDERVGETMLEKHEKPDRGCDIGEALDMGELLTVPKLCPCMLCSDRLDSGRYGVHGVIGPLATELMRYMFEF